MYDSADGAVEVMTRNMAIELGPDGIAVNCVIPGPIAERPGASGKWPDREWISSFVPVGRLGRAEDVAAAPPSFFCLPESQFTIGQSLLVDGGYAAPLPE